MGCFSPVTSSVQSDHRPVSYYAFLKGWLPPSPPSGCRESTTSFPTKQPLWDLNVRSGLFPSRLWTLAPKVCLLYLFLQQVKYGRFFSFFLWCSCFLLCSCFLVFFCVLVFFFLQKKQEKHKKVQETKENIKNDPHTIFL